LCQESRCRFIFRARIKRIFYVGSSNKDTAEGANFKVIEFGGEAITTMPTLGRLTICNMSVEVESISGIVPPDAESIRYLNEVAEVNETIRYLNYMDQIYASQAI
jgi:homoaconitase/3-isopropylmalate dehydratase large subunit